MKDWNEYGEWHRLLDAMCNHNGFYDNSDLAAELCARTGRKRQEDFDAARKKLRSWRTGRRLPQRANLLVVSSILGLNKNPELERHWHALYQTARKAGHETSKSLLTRAPYTGKPAFGRPWRAPRHPVALGAFLSIAVGIAVAVGATGRQPGLSGLPEVGYEAYVRLSAGTSRLIHGEYGSCDGPPPPWEAVAIRVPSTDLGAFADGGLARKMVNDCGREMAVRAVMFTATVIGIEEMYILDDYMKIEVLDTASGLAGRTGR
ncbi:MAG: hypothetical protein ABTQ31_18570 [Rhizobiaceae bacterium]